MNNTNNHRIIMELMPSLRMFWIENSGLFVIYLIMILLSGYENKDVAVCSMILAFLIEYGVSSPKYLAEYTPGALSI